MDVTVILLEHEAGSLEAYVYLGSHDSLLSRAQEFFDEENLDREGFALGLSALDCCLFFSLDEPHPKRSFFEVAELMPATLIQTTEGDI
jgi:hypothetical protein